MNVQMLNRRRPPFNYSIVEWLIIGVFVYFFIVLEPMMLGQLGILMGSIVIHELAHGYVANLCGDPTAKNARTTDIKSDSTCGSNWECDGAINVDFEWDVVFIWLGQAGSCQCGAIKKPHERYGQSGHCGPIIQYYNCNFFKQIN